MNEMKLFQAKKRGASSACSAERPAVYFCAEYGITDKLPIYSGGLGVLAGDIFQEAAERHHNFVAIGLFYQKGYFHQFIDDQGQHESPQNIDPTHAPLALAVDDQGETVLLEVPVNERIVYVQVWRYQYHDNYLYLLDTNHWKNSPEDRPITDQLYSGGQDKRIQQEIVLGIGGFRLLEQLEIQPAIYHMNEGHSAFLGLELLRTEMIKNGGDWDKAFPKVQKQLVFTNHTLVPAGNDAFPAERIAYFLGKYAFDSNLGIERVLGLGKTKEKPDHFSMAVAAMRLSGKSNAVSRLHAKEAKKNWPEFKLEAITNGVHLPQWVAPELQELWDEYLPDWRQHTADPKAWKGIAKLSDRKLWEAHQTRKEALLEEVYNRQGIRLDPDVFTVVWARRFATYKRPDLLFSDMDRLQRLVFNEKRPMQIIVAGKSHPADGQGKEIIDKIEYLGNYALKHHAVFVDDYSISLAKYLVSGADLWLNTPIFGLEASGTSGMKASANGVIQFTTPDGWAWEVDWYGLGYTLPIHKAETEIYKLFEQKILPCYYRRNHAGIPERWLAMMKDTIAVVSPRFSSTRMVNDYHRLMYPKNLD